MASNVRQCLARIIRLVVMALGCWAVVHPLRPWEEGEAHHRGVAEAIQEVVGAQEVRCLQWVGPTSTCS